MMLWVWKIKHDSYVNIFVILSGLRFSCHGYAQSMTSHWDHSAMYSHKMFYCCSYGTASYIVYTVSTIWTRTDTYKIKVIYYNKLLISLCEIFVHSSSLYTECNFRFGTNGNYTKNSYEDGSGKPSFLSHSSQNVRVVYLRCFPSAPVVVLYRWGKWGRAGNGAKAKQHSKIHCFIKFLKKCYLSLILFCISPWHMSFRNGCERGRSTSLLSCNTFARKTPRNQKYFTALSQAGESCGRGAGKRPDARRT